MKKPRKIKLFGYELSVKWDGAVPESDPKYMGRSYSHWHEIWCDKTAKGRGQTLLHETLHHISNRLELGFEEKSIEPLATALAEFIRLNPKVVRFIQESE